MNFKKDNKIDKEAVRRALSRSEIRECLLEMAKGSCMKFGGMAEIGGGFFIVDSSKYVVSPDVQTVQVAPYTPVKETLGDEIVAKTAQPKDLPNLSKAKPKRARVGTVKKYV